MSVSKIKVEQVGFADIDELRWQMKQGTPDGGNLPLSHEEDRRAERIRVFKKDLKQQESLDLYHLISLAVRLARIACLWMSLQTP